MNSLEILEPRIAPALVMPTVTNGVLLIQHQGGAGETAEHIVVTQTEPDKFKVEDTVANPMFPIFTGVKSIVVQAADLGDKIDMSFSHDGLPGSLDISIPGPVITTANTINLMTVDGISGLIAGKVNIHGSADNDSVNIQGGLAIASPVTFEGGDGTDTFTPDGAILAKKLTLESVEDITTKNSYNPVLIGSMLVENEDANAPVVFILGHITTVLGPLTYCGSATVPDSVTLDGQVIGPAKLMLLDGKNDVKTAGTFGNGLSITGGLGDDTVDFHTVSLNTGDSTKPPFIVANVAGAVTMKLGDGTNAVTLEDASFFAKNVSIATGIGADTVNFASFSALKNVTLALGGGTNKLTAASDNYVGGAFKYSGGAADDTVNLDGLLAGTISVALGDGPNSVSGHARIAGKSASITGGAGVDTIDLASTGGTLSAKLGAGNDTFTFEGGALAAAKLDGGADDDTLSGLTRLPPAAKTKIVGFEHTS